MLLSKLIPLLICTAVITACDDKSDSVSSEALSSSKKETAQKTYSETIKTEKSNLLSIFKDAKEIITEVETVLDSDLNLENVNIDEIAEKLGSVAKKVGKNAKQLESGLSKIASEIEKGLDEGYNGK